MAPSKAQTEEYDSFLKSRISYKGKVTTWNNKLDAKLQGYNQGDPTNFLETYLDKYTDMIQKY